jgi:hypothetical protein
MVVSVGFASARWRRQGWGFAIGSGQPVAAVAGRSAAYAACASVPARRTKSWLSGLSWRRSARSVTLVVQPSYSPELNPVERVWLYLRERFLSLRLLHSTEDIIDACCDAWMRLVAEPDRIKSLCSYPWIMKVAS